MNYTKIHDSIITKAKNRDLDENVYYEFHHIIPKCEGGLQSGETVQLTQKEHRLIHFLRYKISGNVKNLYAYHLLRNSARENITKIAGRLSHEKFKSRDPIAYANRQRNAGIYGGISARENKRGFHSMSEHQLSEARSSGRKTIVENKIGMFSDEYRKLHAENLKKKVLTPDGIFDSMSEVSIYYNISPGTVTYRVNSESLRFSGWTFVANKGE